MKKSFSILMLALFGIFLNSQVMGQGGDNSSATNGLSLGMPELNLLNSASATINLMLTTAVAGEAVQSSKSDSTARVKISSVVAASATRILTAKVTTGAIPGGTTLKLGALAPNSNFGGTKGNLLLNVPLSSSSDASIVTGIGSCYSGTTAGDGYVLKYTWGLDNPAANYGAVRASAGAAITVTLTLSAGS
jgi:hypothetical protein